MSNPIDLLPIQHPIDHDPSIGNVSYFYDNVSKYLIKDIIRVMSNGMYIDIDRVKELESTVVSVLTDVKTTLSNNTIISEFQKLQYKKAYKDYVSDRWTKKRDYTYYMKKEYKDNIGNRTVLLNLYLNKIGKNYLCRDRWSTNDVKRLNKALNDSTIDKLLSKDLIGLENEAMIYIAKSKAKVYNKSIANKIKNVDKAKLLPEFNPASSNQKAELFKYIGMTPIKLTKKGADSWGRKELEITVKAIDNNNKELIEAITAMIDHSFSAIIRNNFIKAFKNYTVDGVLYGELKLFGAKSFRLTSSNPNLLNLPSTGSIYAKPVKRCLVAPKGYLILTADYKSLEDRVIANLSKDKNKISIFVDGIDGHSLATCVYIKDEAVDKLRVPYDTDIKELARLFYNEVQNGNKWFKDKRQWSKDKTFKLSYGGYPDIDKGGSITQEIFDNYHSDMYPEISEFRSKVEEYVRGNGYTHLGLGCRMYSDNVGKYARTLFNANSQFWSILTLLTINKLHTMIDNIGYKDDIKCISTIYDSIYFIVREDTKIIKWLNDNLIGVMCIDYLKNQIVKNEAEAEIGYNWADLTALPNNATEKEITTIVKGIKC